MSACLCRDRIARWAALAAAVLLFATLLLVANAAPTLAGQNPTQDQPQQPPNPYLILQVNYGQDWVEGSYEVGHTVWLTVTDNVGTVKATAELQTQQIPWWGPGQTGFSTSLGDPWAPTRPDMVAGDWVYGRVDNERTAEVRLGEITGNLDLDDDIISGHLYAGWLPPPVRLWCGVWEENGPGLDAIWVDPDGGSYDCDIGAAGWDLQPGDDVGVTYQEPDGDEVINMFMAPAADLILEKWPEGSGQAYPGGPVVFGLRVQNQGNADASQVIVTDTLPVDTSYLSDTSGAVHTTVGSTQVVWDLGPLAAGDEVRFHLYLLNTSDDGETLHNVADAWTVYDQDRSNDHAEAEVQVVDELPDLYVDKNPETGNPAPGETMLWRLDYGNQGPVASGPTVLTDTIPAGTTIVEWWSENDYGWTEVAANGQLVLESPSIPGYWGDQLFIRLELDSGLAPKTQLTNTVEITAMADADPGNNWQQRDDVWVSDKYWNAGVDKGLGGGTLVPGGKIEYNLYVRNHGNVAASFTLTDVLPVGTSFVSAWRQIGPMSVDFPPDYVNGSMAVWDLGVMEPGDWMNLQVGLAIANSTAAGSLLENCALVAMDHADAWPYDNESCLVNQVNASGPNLSIAKSYQWNGEGQLEYELQLRNLGTTKLSQVDFSDTLPEDTSFNGNWSYGYHEPVTLTHQTADQLTWTVRRMEPGASFGLRFQVDLDGGLVGVPGLAFTNTVEAPITGDVVPADNMDTVTAFTGPDLYVKKQHGGGQPVPGGIVTFTVEFGNANRGPWGTSAGTHLTDTLPAAMTFITATAPWDPSQRWHPESEAGNIIVWDSGGQGPDSISFFDLVVEIDPAASSGDTLVNTIVVGSDNPLQDVEYDYSNNAAEATVIVEAPYHLYLPLVFKNY